MLRNQHIPKRTDVERNLQGDAELILDTNLTAKSEAEAVVAAITQLGARSDIPVETTADGQNPVVHAGQVEIVVGVFGQAEVNLKTVATKTLLIGKLSAIATTTAKTDTDSVVLCICCKTHSHNSGQN